MFTLTVANHKGGVGKTSTALAIAQGLRLHGYSVLSLDLDPQSNFTFSCLNMQTDITAYDLLTNSEKALLKPVNVCKYKSFSLDVIASSQSLSLIANELNAHALSMALQPYSNDYEFCIIDAPPALNMLTLNALTASNGVLIPIMADSYSLQALSQMNDTINEIQASTNPFLTVTGILYNFYNPRAVISRQIEQPIEQQAKALNTKIFNTRIRRAQDVSNASSLGVSIYEYKPNSNATILYNSLIDEIIERCNRG